MFDDLLEANRLWASKFSFADMAGRPARGIAILCCMDARLNPYQMLGLSTGDAKILRTPGGHLSPDIHNGLVVASQLLGVRRIMIIEHTNCAMASSDDAIRDSISANGFDASNYIFGADANQIEHVKNDVQALRDDPLVTAEVGGFIYNVTSGIIEQII